MKTIIAVLFVCSVALIGCNRPKEPVACPVNVSEIEFSYDGVKWTTLPHQYWRMRYDGKKTNLYIRSHGEVWAETSMEPIQ